MIWDVWHTQLRLVAKHFPGGRLRAISSTNKLPVGTHFVYVSPTVDRRETRVVPSSHIVGMMVDSGRIIIHIQEPRE